MDWWQAYNQTREVELGNKIARADTYLKRLTGLLPKASLAPGEGLWLVPCKDIHSIGMRFVFDAVFLDASGQVVHLIKNMKPFRISALIYHAKTVLELPAGIISNTDTQLGDSIVFTQSNRL